MDSQPSVVPTVEALVAAGERVGPLWRCEAGPPDAEPAPAPAPLDLEAINDKLRALTESPGPPDEEMGPQVEQRYNKLVERGAPIARPWIPIHGSDLNEEQLANDGGYMYLANYYYDARDFWRMQFKVWFGYRRLRKREGLPPTEELDRADALTVFMEHLQGEFERDLQDRKDTKDGNFDIFHKNGNREFIDGALFMYAAAERELRHLRRSGNGGDSCAQEASEPQDKEAQDRAWKALEAEVEKLRTQYGIPPRKDWYEKVDERLIFGVGSEEEKQRPPPEQISPPQQPRPPSSHGSSKRSRHEMEDGDGAAALPPQKRPSVELPPAEKDVSSKQHSISTTRQPAKYENGAKDLQPDTTQNRSDKEPTAARSRPLRGRQTKRGAARNIDDKPAEAAKKGAAKKSKNSPGKAKSKPPAGGRGQVREKKQKKPRTGQKNREAKTPAAAVPLRRSLRIAAMQKKKKP